MLPQPLKAFKLRNVGPAFVSGRIADIAVHPNHDNTWYVGTASGGVWKTKNAGITWDPVFDNEKSFASGCITVDPGNPATVWVGTGENVGGRHIAFGDGIYRSDDEGKSWKNMSDVVSGGAGPHYYQELYASPHAFDRLYLMDVRVQVSEDGGKSFRQLR